MTNAIQGLQTPAVVQPGRPAAPSLGNVNSAGTSFKDFLVDSIHQANAMQQDANAAVETLMTGGEINPAEVMTAVQKADLAFRMLMQIRNKLMDAYNEVKEIRV